MLLDELQRQMDRPGQVTGFVVHATDKSSTAVAEIRRQIEAMDPEIAATPCAEFVELDQSDEGRADDVVVDVDLRDCDRGDRSDEHDGDEGL